MKIWPKENGRGAMDKWMQLTVLQWAEGSHQNGLNIMADKFLAILERHDSLQQSAMEVNVVSQ